MKKFFVLIIAMTYVFSSMGMNVAVHYCKGKLQNIEWKDQNKKGCCGKDKSESKKCCKNKFFQHEGNDPHEQVKAFLSPQKFVYTFLYSYVTTFIKPAVGEKKIVFINDFSPDKKQLNFNTLYCIFRI